MRLLLSCAVLAVAVLGTTSRGQVVSAPTMDQYDQELQRIGVVRQQKTAELDAEDAACFDKFAVNDCQNKVSARRRQLLAELKRQESVVRDAQRQLRAADQLERSADKAAQQARKAAELRYEPPENRQQAQDDKVISHRQQARKVEPKASTPKLASGLDEQTQAGNRAAFQEKQQAADKRRRDREQRLIDHGKGAPPLPVAP